MSRSFNRSEKIRTLQQFHQTDPSLSAPLRNASSNWLGALPCSLRKGDNNIDAIDFHTPCSSLTDWTVSSAQ
jgi:hypothetical protein